MGITSKPGQNLLARKETHASESALEASKAEVALDAVAPPFLSSRELQERHYDKLEIRVKLPRELTFAIHFLGQNKLASSPNGMEGEGHTITVHKTGHQGSETVYTDIGPKGCLSLVLDSSSLQHGAPITSLPKGFNKASAKDALRESLEIAMRISGQKIF